MRVSNPKNCIGRIPTKTSPIYAISLQKHNIYKAAMMPTHSKPQPLTRLHIGAFGLPWWAFALMVCTWGLILRLTVLRRRRPGTEFTQVDSFAVIEIILVFTAALLLILKPGFMEHIWDKLHKTSARFLFCFFILAVGSAAWSPMSTYSLFRAGEFLIESTAIATILACSNSFRQAERLLLISVFAVTIMDILYNIRSFGFALESLRSNSYSVSALMIFAYALGEAVARSGNARKVSAAVAGIALVFVLFGRSMASWWCALLAILLAFLLARSKRYFFIIGTTMIGLLISIAGVQKLQPIIDPYGELDKVEDLHGRELLWKDYLETIRQNPWLGVGYAIGPRIAGSVYTTNAHNSAIAVVLGTGLVGGLLLLIALIIGSREALMTCKSGRLGSVGAVTALAAGSVNSMSISVFGDAWAPSSFVFMMFYGFFLFAVLRPQWPARQSVPGWGTVRKSRQPLKSITLRYQARCSAATRIPN
jgi:O-antigen ligase